VSAVQQHADLAAEPRRPEDLKRRSLGWIGTGRMGSALITRLLGAGCDLTIYNRTRSKAEPLVQQGARVVDRPDKLADRDIVFSTVAGSDDFYEVVLGPGGLLSAGRGPKVLVDSSTVSMEISERVRARAQALGTALLAAPVSGNPNVVRSGQLTAVVSGPPDAYEMALPYVRPVSYTHLTLPTKA